MCLGQRNSTVQKSKLSPPRLLLLLLSALPCHLPPITSTYGREKRALRFLLNKFRPPSNQQFLSCNIMASSLPHPLPLLFFNPNNYIHLVYETTYTLLFCSSNNYIHLVYETTYTSKLQFIFMI